jgi:hypothetical protein
MCTSEIFILFTAFFSIRCVNFLFIKFSIIFLLGTTMNLCISKCCQANGTAFVNEALLSNYLPLVSNVGPLLLVFMTIDSLLVMTNSFMIYLT